MYHALFHHNDKLFEFKFTHHTSQCIFQLFHPHRHNNAVLMHWSHLYSALTHWGRVTHICVGKLTIIDSDNGLSPGRRQAIIWTNAGILLIGHLGTNFSEILIAIQTFSFKKMHLKMSSAKWRLFCLGLNVLSHWYYSSQIYISVTDSRHYNDVIMSTVASLITSLAIVYSTVYSDADQRKHPSSASLAFVRGIHRWPVNFPHYGQQRGKCFHLMTSSWATCHC